MAGTKNGFNRENSFKIIINSSIENKIKSELPMKRIPIHAPSHDSLEFKFVKTNGSRAAAPQTQHWASFSA